MDVKEAILEASQQFQICLKDKQFEAIHKFCSRNDVFASLTPINDPLKPIHTNKQSPKSGDLVEQIR